MAGFYDKLIRPVMFGLDAETAHEIGIESLRMGLGADAIQRIARRRFASSGSASVERFGLRFANPVGIAAGFDKNGVVVNQLAALGFGFVEVGTVTFRPQTGNEKPRLFRLREDRALINRLGFNNDGAEVIAARLRSMDPQCVVGVNIGKNKDVPIEDAVENYLACFDLVFDVADYIAVNISSPNTPNLRELQRGENLEELLKALRERNHELSRVLDPKGKMGNAKPLLVKIAPDLTEAEIELIVDVSLRHDVAGLIATNTTISRDGLKGSHATETGGLSGRPLARRSTEIIRTVHRCSNGKLPIVGVGGIFTPEDAFEKIAAGACLLQGYTGFVYVGPSYARDINIGLPQLIKERGFANLDEVVGSGA